jgi:hypothetical protein
MGPGGKMRTNMNAMKKVAKMLALMPVVALAAACNGVAPTSSTGLSTDLSGTDNGGVSATGLTNRACALVHGIDLQVVGDNDANVTILATYKYSQPTSVDCQAPVWTSTTSVLAVDKANPFRVAVVRTAGDRAVVRATAPNGATNTISVIVRPTTSDPTHDAVDPVDPMPAPRPNVPTTPNRPTPALNACRLIDGVTLSAVRQVGGTVALSAAYTYSQAVPLDCATAPQWSATRKGLTVNPRDGFKASIPADSDAETVVVATAPNGVQNKVSF